MATQLERTNTRGPSKQEIEQKNVRNLLILTNLEKPTDKVFSVIPDRNRVEMGEGKIAEEEVLWCTNDSGGPLNTALVDNITSIKGNISSLQPEIGVRIFDESEKIQDDLKLVLLGNDTENRLPIPSSLGPDEPLQFELDNRNFCQPSITISTSQDFHHSDLPSIKIGLKESVIDRDSTPVENEINRKSNVGKESLESLNIEPKAISHPAVSCNPKTSRLPMTQKGTSPPPPSLFFPDQVNIVSDDKSRLRSQTQQVSPSRLHRKGRVVRPFVYSAIGSLEFINQNSLGSFNQKLCLASKTKTKFAGKAKTRTLQKMNKAHEDCIDASLVNEDPFMQTKRLSTNVTPINITQSRDTENKNRSYNYAQVEDSAEDKESLLRHETKVSQLEDEDKKSLHQQPQKCVNDSKLNTKGEFREKKRVTVRPVELFRPSCDAYTPRMGRKEIKYKPATERAFMEEISTTMGTIQRPNFRDALRRVAIIIQQHIVKIERRFAVGVPGLDNAGLFTPAMRVAFAEDNFVTPRYKCNMVNIPMARPGVIYGMRKIRTKYNIPTASDIYEFAHKIFNSVQLSSECSIICLIYVERLMEVAKVPVMANTWRPIFMCGLLLASKVWQDWSSWNVEFASVYPQFTLSSINRLEVQFLKMLKWNLYISPSLYAKYYFALRSLLEKQDFRHRYNRMVGADSRAALEAIKVSKRSEIVKQEALLHLSMSM